LVVRRCCFDHDDGDDEDRLLPRKGYAGDVLHDDVDDEVFVAADVEMTTKTIANTNIL
jgi:hypothetical protein